VVETLGVGKTKVTDAFPYATTLVINARACKTDVPSLLAAGTDVTTIGALVKATVEVRVLREIDEDVVLELLAGGKAGAPVMALGNAGMLEMLSDDVTPGVEEELGEVLDAVCDVALAKLDEESPGNMGVLLNAGGEDELARLNVALVRLAGDGDKAIVVRLLEALFSGNAKLVNSGVGSAEAAVVEEDTRLKFVELPKPAGVELIVVGEITTSDVLINKPIELDVELTPNDGRVGETPIVEVGSPTDTGKLDVAAGELRSEVEIEVGGMIPDEIPPADVRVEDGRDDADDPIGENVETVGGMKEEEARVLDGTSDDEVVIGEDDASPGVVSMGVDSGVEGSRAIVDDVNSVLAMESNDMLER
jgi:hypothetical protein